MDWYTDNQPTRQEAFSKLLPRIHNGAIVLLHKEMRRGVEAARSSRAAAARPQSRRLNYIPRP